MGPDLCALLLGLALDDTYEPAVVDNTSELADHMQPPRRNTWRLVSAMDAAVHGRCAELGLQHPPRVEMSEDALATALLDVYKATLSQRHLGIMPGRRGLTYLNPYTDASLARVLLHVSRRVRLTREHCITVQSACQSSGFIVQTNYGQHTWALYHALGLDSYETLDVPVNTALQQYRPQHLPRMRHSIPADASPVARAHVVVPPRVAGMMLFDRAFLSHREPSSVRTLPVQLCLKEGSVENLFDTVHMAIVRVAKCSSDAAMGPGWVRLGPKLKMKPAAFDDEAASVLVSALVPTFNLGVVCGPRATVEVQTYTLHGNQLRTLHPSKPMEYSQVIYTASMSDASAVVVDYHTTCTGAQSAVHAATVTAERGNPAPRGPVPAPLPGTFAPRVPTAWIGLPVDALTSRPLPKGKWAVKVGSMVAEMRDAATWKHLFVQITATGPSLTKAFATMPAPTVSQSSPCVIEVVLRPQGSKIVSIPLAFPVPVTASRVGVRFSRKRFFVQVSAPPARAMDNPAPFAVLPMVTAGDAALVGRTTRPSRVVSWALPRVPLSLLPTVSGSALLHNLARILPHASMSSAEEDAVRSKTPPTTPQLIMLALKQTLQILLVRAVGAPSGHAHAPARGPKQWFVLVEKDPHDASANSMQGFLYISSVRTSCERQTAVLDACVHMADGKGGPARTTAALCLARAVQSMVHQIPCSRDELSQMRRLLCAAAESARAGWSHRRTCEYVTHGAVPVGLGKDCATLCACGEGVALPASFRRSLREDAGVSPSDVETLCSLFTRVALPAVLFAPSSAPSRFAASAAAAQRAQARMVQSHMAAAGFSPAVAARSSEANAMLEMLQSGMGMPIPERLTARIGEEVLRRVDEKVSAVIVDVLQREGDGLPQGEAFAQRLTGVLDGMGLGPLPPTPPSRPTGATSARGGARAPAVPPRSAGAGATTTTGSTCAQCGNTRASTGSTMLRCGRCKKVRYCDRNCQKAHWKLHKKTCQK